MAVDARNDPRRGIIVKKIADGLMKKCPFDGVTVNEAITATPTGQAIVLKGRFRSQDIALKVFLEPAEYEQEAAVLRALTVPHENVLFPLRSFEKPRPAVVYVM